MCAILSGLVIIEGSLVIKGKTVYLRAVEVLKEQREGQTN